VRKTTKGRSNQARWLAALFHPPVPSASSVVTCIPPEGQISSPRVSKRCQENVNPHRFDFFRVPLIPKPPLQKKSGRQFRPIRYNRNRDRARLPIAAGAFRFEEG